MRVIFLLYTKTPSKDQIKADIKQQMLKQQIRQGGVYINGKNCGTVNLDTTLDEFVNTIDLTALETFGILFVDDSRQMQIPFSYPRLSHPEPKVWSSYTGPVHSIYERDLSLQLEILTEGTARSLIGAYTNGCYVVFRKQASFHILTKQNTAIEEYEVVAIENKVLSCEKSYQLNLKDQSNNLCFESAFTTGSLNHFIQNLQGKNNKFKHLITTRNIEVFSQMNFYSYPEELNNLQNMTIKSLLKNKPDLSWLGLLPELIQQQALFYFINMFVVNFANTVQMETLEQNQKKLYYRKHYDLEEIKKKLDILRYLAQTGNVFAGKALATLVFTGLVCESGKSSSLNYQLLPFFNHLHPQPPGQFKDLEEYRTLTQNPAIYPEKIIRDFHLLRYFEEKKDLSGKAKLLKDINLVEAINMDLQMFSDDTLIQCIETDEFNKLEELVPIEGVLASLIKLRRTKLVDWLKDKLPDNKLREIDKDGRNILHSLIDNLDKYKVCNSYFVLRSFTFICNRFPEMLLETDKEGHSVLMTIEDLLANTNSDYFKTKLQPIVDAYASQYLPRP